MTFVQTKDKQTLIKFAMVRITPARCMTASLSLVAGVYKCAWTRPVARVERNGVALTNDTTTPASNDHYWFDEDNQLFYVKLASAPSDTTNVVCLFYYIFVTSGMAILANEEPGNGSLPLRQWEPRLTQEPKLSQSVSNIISGIFSISDTAFTLVNADNWFNQWFSIDDSWNEKDVNIWLGAKATEADTPYFPAIYLGKVKSIVLDRSSLTLTVLDAFSRMNQPALMGDSAGECYFRREAGSYLFCDPARIGETVPIYFGPYSWYLTKALQSWDSYLQFDQTATPKAVCTGYNPSVGTNNNRLWHLGRVSADGLRAWGSTLSGLTLTGVANSTNSLILSYSGGGVLALDIAIGDTLQISQATLPTLYGRVARIDDTHIYIISTATVTYAYTTAVTITQLSLPALMIEDTQTGYCFFPAPTLDYTASALSTTGGNKLVSISFVNGFEVSRNLYPFDNSANGAAMTTLDPSRHNVYFRMTPAVTNYGNHADILKYMCSLSGLTPNPSTFSAAKSALAVNGLFSVPYLDETDFRLYINYVQDLLASTLAILSLDSGSGVEYNLVQLPSSADTTDDNVILRQSANDLSIALDYQDVTTQLVAYNPHNNSAAAIAASPSPSETRTNLRAQYLHGVVNSVVFRHVLETITGRIDQILAAKSNRRATYTFDVANKFIDAQIGQNTVVGGDCLLGADTSRAVKIFSLDRSSDLCTVAAVDLQGIS